jgi:hypothetical protein
MMISSFQIKFEQKHNKSGKKSLILDLSVLNKFVKREKFKFEDWKTAVQFFNKDMFLSGGFKKGIT